MFPNYLDFAPSDGRTVTANMSLPWCLESGYRTHGRVKSACLEAEGPYLTFFFSAYTRNATPARKRQMERARKALMNPKNPTKIPMEIAAIP
jgi:hypothetical protein